MSPCRWAEALRASSGMCWRSVWFSRSHRRTVGLVSRSGQFSARRLDERRAVVRGNCELVRKPLGDLARGAPRAGLDLLDGDDGAAHPPGQLDLSQIERFASPPDPVAEGGRNIHRVPLPLPTSRMMLRGMLCCDLTI